MQTVTHKLTAGGVVLHTREGTAVRLTRLSDAEARRLAWGLLADLEPDEQPLAAARPRRRSEAPTREAVLKALSEGPGSRHQISKRAGFTITCASIIQAVDRGLVERVGPISHARALATYQLTDAGLQELGLVEEAA